MSLLDTPEEVLPCFRCGFCCTEYQVRLDTAELNRVAGCLGINETEFIARYTDPRWPGTASFLLRHENGQCVFLERPPGDNETACSIHSFRPRDCRDWTPGISRPACQLGLAKWGLKVDEGGKLSGAAANIRRFQVYIETLA